MENNDENKILKIDYELKTVEELETILKSPQVNQVEKEGCKVIIAGAGLAAHLPGVIASKTILPVIGIPVKAALEGVDALYSIVQMPKSIPVATVGINNSYNAGLGWYK